MLGSSRRGAITTTLYTPRPGVEWDLRVANLSITQPSGTLTIYGAGDLEITQPSGTLSAFGFIEHNELYIEQPAGALSAFGGGELSITQPSGTLSAVAVTSVIGSLSIKQPAGTLTASAVTGSVGYLSIKQKSGTLNAYGGGELTITQPAGTLSALSIVGGVGELSIIQPSGALSGSIFNNYALATVSITQPAGMFLNGSLSILQPAGKLFGQVVSQQNNLIAYAMNIKTSEMTTYSNYAFQGILRIGYEYYGVKSDGLYQLTGITDNGTTIDARFKTTQTDMGVSNLKRVPYVYHDSENQINVTPTYTKQPNNTKTIVGTFASSIDGNRTKLARGAEGKHWQFEISNVNGNELKVGSLEALAEVLSRKI